MINNQAFNEAASMMSSQKLALKLTCNDITKRVRDLPESFEALKTTVKAQMSKKGGAAEQFIRTDQYAVTYEDDTGDVINVSDDEDLFAAYDVAENCLNRQLKLNIKPRPRSEGIAVAPEAKAIDSKTTQKIESQPFEETKKEDENMEAIDSSAIKIAIKEAMNPT